MNAGGIPYQKSLSAAEAAFELGRHDLTGAIAPEDAARHAIQVEFTRPFDLSRAPLLRASLFRVGERRWLLSLVVHHIVADGWSLDVLFRELSALYAGSPSLPALPIQYRDYSQWMAGRIGQDALRTERAFWKESLPGRCPC